MWSSIRSQRRPRRPTSYSRLSPRPFAAFGDDVTRFVSISIYRTEHHLYGMALFLVFGKRRSASLILGRFFHTIIRFKLPEAALQGVLRHSKHNLATKLSPPISRKPVCSKKLFAITLSFKIVELLSNTHNQLIACGLSSQQLFIKLSINSGLKGKEKMFLSL